MKLRLNLVSVRFVLHKMKERGGWRIRENGMDQPKTKLQSKAFWIVYFMVVCLLVCLFQNI